MTNINYFWFCDDKTDREVSPFDWVNIIQCAKRRAVDVAGIDSERFSGEYQTVVRLAPKVALKGF